MKTMRKTPTFLAATAMQAFWDKDVSMLALGSWCFPLGDTLDSNLDIQLLELAQVEFNKEKTFNKVIALYDELFPLLATWLNKIHAVNYSLSYWQVIIGPFLIFYINILYTLFQFLQKAYELYPQLDTIGLEASSYLTPISFDEVFWLSGDSDRWNLQLITQLLILAFKTPLRYKRTDWLQDPLIKKRQEQPYIPLAKTCFKKIIDKIKSKYIAWRGNKMIDVCHYYHGFDTKSLWRLFIQSGFRIMPLPKKFWAQAKASMPEMNKGLRAEITNLPVKDAFSRYVLETLKANMPLNFIECYQDTCQQARETYPYRAGVVVAGSAWISHDLVKFYGAELLEKQQSKLVGVQHGGGYGILKYVINEYIEKRMLHVFCSWGWRRDANVMPMPSTLICKQLDRLEAFSQRQKSKKDAFILWCNNDVTCYPRDLIWGGFDQENYLIFQKRFVQALADPVKNHLLLRLRPGCPIINYYQANFQNITLAMPGEALSFFQQLFDARIFVSDTPMTTYNYALAYNIPTIMFWDFSRFEFYEDVWPFLEKLKQVGVLHDSPESAAVKLNEISKDPELWWQQPEVQEARKNYCYHFARITPNWLHEWNDLLIKLAR